jgi:hypothetical protein
MLLLSELSELLQAEDPEERQTITGVNWKNYIFRWSHRINVTKSPS